MRIAAFVRAVIEVVQQRVDPGRGDIRILCEIPGCIEQGVRAPALTETVLEIVCEGIDPGRGDVLVRRKIPISIEEFTCSAGPEIARLPMRTQLN
ncbi:hypothetical protein [Methylobacterium symbioticum]|uniref:hypothetical protein n=1 Tax=Methylobacterium symbioticum TaxID=2584084 RepID=UPI0016296CD3|nr:hypothetical protein [Methylobacterium symbioticum]